MNKITSSTAIKWTMPAAAALTLSGCISTGDLLPDGDADFQELSQKETITYHVPDSDGVHNVSGMINDLSFEHFSNWVSDEERQKLFYEEGSGDTFIIHRRVDNGTAGSGVRYKVAYDIEEGDSGYSASLTPVAKKEYQEGVVLPFGVPDFGRNDVRSTLLSAELRYSFEIDSEYGPSSVYANFDRLLESNQFSEGERDAVTGQIFEEEFITRVEGREVTFMLDVHPYRDGSKAVIHAKLPAIETDKNTVDFSEIIEDLEETLTGIAEA